MILRCYNAYCGRSPQYAKEQERWKELFALQKNSGCSIIITSRAVAGMSPDLRV
ncbi:MAG: hypothetical protein NVSMB44_35770 [Ktedonobacteraceae bacterium]